MICILTREAATAAASSLEMGAAISLVVFLIAKEFCNASEDSRLHVLSRYLVLAVIPLFIVFMAVLMARATRLL